MKKYLLVLASLVMILSPLLASKAAFAHVLQTDGDLGAVLHILPDDNPLAGQNTTYELSFSGVKTFSLSGCNCTVSYMKDDKKLKTEQLVATSEYSTKNSYSFEEPGVYTIVVNGTPTESNTFKQFTLQYPIRVAASNQLKAQPFPVTLGVAFGLLTILLLLVAVKADGMLETQGE